MNKLVFSLFAVTILLVSVSVTNTYVWADDKDYCYDEVGDGHNCYETKQKCRNELKHDIAESPCYNRDRADT